MNHPCAESERLQEYLDGELDAAGEAMLRRHLLGCAGCAAELAIYERVFATLDATPMIEPPPHLTGLILERVLPSEVRRRWLRALGWGYGLAAAGSAAAAVALIASPAPRAVVGMLGVEASQRLAQATIFVVDSLALAMVRIAGGWNLVHEIGLKLSPLVRAASTLLDRPGVDLTLALATVTSGIVLLSLRPRRLAARGSSRRREIDHASLFVF